MVKTLQKSDIFVIVNINLFFDVTSSDCSAYLAFTASLFSMRPDVALGSHGTIAIA